MTFKKNIVIFTFLICIFFSISCVVASDVNDTDVATYENQIIGDENNEIISSSQNDLISSSSKGTFTELQQLLNDAPEGSTVTLEKDYYYDNESDKLGVFISKDLTINGKGHTLNGLSKSRILLVTYGLNENNKVILNNIVFKKGYTDNYGGAILNFADLTINKCTFENNYAGIAAGAINSLGSLNCKNSVFKNNKANGSAGAIFSFSADSSIMTFKQYFSTHDMTDISELIFGFMMNQIKIVPLTDHITKCKFTKNVALGYAGGAVYAFTHININSCTFTSNKANELGGAVYGAKNINIKDSKFTSNSAYKYGGAVYFKCHEIKGSYDAQGNWKNSVVFYKCLIKDSVFTKNVVKNRGGAIYGFKYADMPKKPGAQAQKCTFSDNIASINGNELYGGSLKSCTFKNTLTLKKVKVKKSAKSLVLTATFKKGSKIYKNKVITFTIKGNIYKAKTNSKGIAKVTVPSSVLKKLKVGNKVKYQASSGNYIDRKTSKVLS